MKLTEMFLTPKNEYSRPGTPLAEKRAVILHWVGVGGQRAESVRRFFEAGKQTQHYSSAHYCIDLDGTVLRLVPDDEVAWHCGSSQSDPASRKIYTDWARQVFGKYAEDPEHTSPNFVSIGIEMCVLDNDGHFSPETLKAAEELTAELCRKHKIPLESVGTHNMVVGWKDCPRLWTREPALFEQFKQNVRALLA
jgi:N-acetylmuramoyl-L-alanine amidase